MNDESLITLYPVEGRTNIDPLTGKELAAEGEPKPLTSFWLRRLRHGDVTKTKPTPPKASTKKGDI